MSVSKYSAVAAKVRALYGNRLKQEDFERLSAMKSVADIAAYLRGCPGWQMAMESLSDTDVHRGALESVLKLQIQDEYSRIFKFMPMEAKHFLLIFVYRMDLAHILSTLRRIQSGEKQDFLAQISEFYLKHSKVDHAALDRCEDFLGLLAAVEGSMFYEPLRALIAAEGSAMPDYTKASLTLQSVYYINMHKFILRNTRGKEKEILIREISASADLMNVIQVMRVKKFFPGSVMSVTEVLIPKFFKLKPSFFRSLYEAPDFQSAFNMLKTSYYGDLFQENNFEYIEQYEMLWRYSFDKKQLLAGPPTVYTPVAYISLKRYEMERLINIIECVRYGLPAKEAAGLMVY